MSRTSESATTSTREGLHAFCVVCGNFSDDLVLRSSGLKCRNCVGKAANRHYVKLQHRQATQLLSQSLPTCSSRFGGLDLASAIAAEEGCYLSHQQGSSASSSLPLATHNQGSSFTTETSQTQRNTTKPIEEYISSTSVYRTAFERTSLTDGKEGHSAESRWMPRHSAGGAGSHTTQTTTDTFSPDGHGTHSSSFPSGASSPMRHVDAATLGAVVVPPRERFHPTDAHSTQAMHSAEPRKEAGEQRRCSNAAPSRLPPRIRAKATAASSSPPVPPPLASSSSTTARKGGVTAAVAPSSPQKSTKPSRDTALSTLEGGAALSNVSRVRNQYAATVRCVEVEEEEKDSEKGVEMSGRLVDAPGDDESLLLDQPKPGRHASPPTTPCGDMAAVSSISLRQYMRQFRRLDGEEQRFTTTSPEKRGDPHADLPAPRAASISLSCTSSIAGQYPSSPPPSQPTFLPEVVAPSSQEGGCGVGSARKGGVHVPHHVRSEPVQAKASNDPMITADHTGLRRGGPCASGASTTSSLSRMPCHTGSIRGEHFTRQQSRVHCSSEDSSSSSSSSSTPIESPATGSSRSAALSCVDPAKGEADRSRVGSGRQYQEGKKARGATGIPVFPVVDFDSLTITVELVQPSSALHTTHGFVTKRVTSRQNAAATSNGGGSPRRKRGASSRDEGSAATGGTHSRSDSLQSSCKSMGDGYQRQVGTGGESGKFTVTRHIRQRSRSSDRLYPAPCTSAGAGASSSPQLPVTALSQGDQRRSATDADGSESLEVKRLTYRLLVHHRLDGSVLLATERRLYADIIPVLEVLKSAKDDSLPALPTRRLPSLRFATESFAEERRAEVELFLQAAVQSPFYVRHPRLMRLLGLDAFASAGTSPGPLAVVMDRANTSGSCLSSRSRVAPIKGIPMEESSLAAPRERPSQASSQKTEGAASAARRAKEEAVVSHKTHRRSAKTANGVGGEESCDAAQAHLTTDALGAFRGSRAEPVTPADDRASNGEFSRSESYTSVQTSRSSVVRRRKLDQVTSEDLEHVQLGNLLGRGTFGSVYQGLLQTSRGSLMVAVKAMTVGAAVPPEAMEGLLQELDVLCAARHPNIIRFLGSLWSPVTRDLRIFTEYVECGTLRSLIDRFGPPTMLTIQQYMRQILSGLQYLHSLSIAHRDIKGENILVTKNGRIKLSDFGSSSGVPPCPSATDAAVLSGHERVSGGCGSSSGSGAMNGLPPGSPLFMAPEVIQGCVTSPSAADIWSLGCVGIEMLDRVIWREGASGEPLVLLYQISRSRTPPHGLPSEAELATLKAEGRLEEYEGFSLYRDFIRQCVDVDPSLRPTAAELVKHPFLRHHYPKHLRWTLAASAKPPVVGRSQPH